MPLTRHKRMIAKTPRSNEELCGWHMTQLDFMLGQVVKPENWPLFLSYYLRALLPDILTELLNTDHMHFITPHAGNFVHEVISIIQEDQDG